jgi:hypothetical protein
VKKSGESKLLLIILIGAVVLTAFALKPMLTPESPTDVVFRNGKDLIPPGTRIQGDPNAPYVLVEFGEYQCPSCLGVMKPTEEMVKRHKDKLRYVFNFTTVVHGEHPHADMLATAAEAAGLQGKYLEMHHKLFESQKKFEGVSQQQAREEILRVAASLGLDVVKL